MDGVDNTGVVDATSLINARITALNTAGGGVIVFPEGTYLVKDIILKSNVHLQGLGNVIFQKNGGTDETHCAYGYGALGSNTTLTANCTLGSLSCAVTSAASFAEGDYVILRTNEYISGAAGRKQEILKITDITGTTITFDHNVIDNYNTANNAELLVLTPVQNVVIRGIHFYIPTVAGGNVGGCLDFQYGVDILVENNQFTGAGGDPAVRFLTCTQSRITGNSIRDGQNMTTGGYGYGIELDEASHFCAVSNNISSNVRENTFTNRTRYCTYTNNIMVGHYDTGFNTHGAGVSHCLIESNLVAGTASGAGIAIGFGAHSAGDSYIDVIGNTIKNISSFGILSNAPSGKQNSNITIRDNTIYNYGLVTVSSVGIYCNYTNYCDIQNNSIQGVTTNAANGIYVKDSPYVVVTGNKIRDIPNGYGITLDNTSSTFVEANHITGISSYNVRGLNSPTSTLVSNNWADDTTNLFVSGITQRNNSWNIFTGSATYDPANLVDGTGVTTTVTCTGATLGMQVDASFSLNLQGITMTAYVSSNDTVSVRFQNETGGPIDLGSGTITVRANSSNG
jgi:polygalacturonase